MNICVVGGAGYVGLTTAIGFAEMGHKVIAVDINKERVKELQKGIPPYYEEDLVKFLKRNLENGRIRFTSRLLDGLKDRDIIFITVDTPSTNDGHADTSKVIQVCEFIARQAVQLKEYIVVVLKSTVPPGTANLVRSTLSRTMKEGKKFDVVSNPEFLRSGKGLFDFFHPDRIVIGAQSQRANDVVRRLYAPIFQDRITFNEAPMYNGSFGENQVPVIETTMASSEMIKYASNIFLATRISFINEVAGICEEVGADIKEVAKGIGYDKRIGHAYLDAGLGFGGPCLEKDLTAMIKTAEINKYDAQLLKAVLLRNDKQIDVVMSKLAQFTKGPLSERVFAVFGLAFKPGSDDVRDSLAFRVIDRLLEAGSSIRAHDPIAIANAKKIRPEISYYENPYEAVKQADVLLILTDWRLYRELDYKKIKSCMAKPYIVDTRNILDMDEMYSLGFKYTGIGRGTE